MKSHLNRIVIFTALVLVMGLATTADAEFYGRPVRLDGRVGAALPSGTLGNRIDPGTAVSAALSFPFSDRIELMGDFMASFHGNNSDRSDMEMDIYYYFGRVGITMLESYDEQLKLKWYGGLGAMSFALKHGSTDTNFAMNTGLTLDYAFVEHASLFVAPQLDIAFTDSNGVLNASEAVMWPVMLGLQVSL